MGCLCQFELLWPISACGKVCHNQIQGSLPCMEASITAGTAWAHGRAFRPGPSTSTPLQPCPFAGRHLSMPKSPLCIHRAGKLYQSAWQQSAMLATAHEPQQLLGQQARCCLLQVKMLPSAGEGEV